MTPTAKLKLLERLNEAFEEQVAKVQRPKMRNYIKTINEEIIEKQPRTAKELRDIINAHKVDTKYAVKMFSVLQAATGVIAGRPEKRSQVKQVEQLMRTYNVTRPKSFVTAIHNMTTGRGMSNTQERFRPILLAHYDGYTETIESVEKQAERAMARTQLASKSTMFKDIENLRKQRKSLREIKTILTEKYVDNLRVDTAVETELHEQAERIKLEQSKFMGYTHKEWVTQGDEKVRNTKFHQHFNKGKVIVPIDSNFRAGGLEADYPGDPTLPVGERIRCRCYVIYHNSPEGRVRTSTIPTPPPAPPRPTPPPTPAFVPASTVAEATQATRQISPNILVRDYFERLTNQDVVLGSLNRINELQTRYGFMKKYTLTLDRELKSQRADAQYQYYSLLSPARSRNNNIINLSVSSYKKSMKTSEIAEKQRSASAVNWHPKVDEGSEHLASFEHELGHHIQIEVLTLEHFAKLTKSPVKMGGKEINPKEMFDEYMLLVDKARQQKISGTVLSKPSDQIIYTSSFHYKEMVYQQYKKDYGQDIEEAEVKKMFQSEISRYGLENNLEFFAETWTEWRLNTKNPSNLAKAFGKVIGGILDEIG